MLRESVKLLILGFVCGLGKGCGTSSSTAQLLLIRMAGTFDAPSDATGAYEPVFHTYTFVQAALVDSSGTETKLYEGEAKEFKIINRNQIIFSYEIKTEQVDVAYSALVVTLKDSVKGMSKYKDDHTLTLPSTTLSTTSGVTIGKGKNANFIIKVKWKNTVTRDETVDPPTDTMSLPTLSLEADKP